MMRAFFVLMRSRPQSQSDRPLPIPISEIAALYHFSDLSALATPDEFLNIVGALDAEFIELRSPAAKPSLTAKR
jgi:hypothetical protein